MGASCTGTLFTPTVVHPVSIVIMPTASLSRVGISRFGVVCNPGLVTNMMLLVCLLPEKTPHPCEVDEEGGKSRYHEILSFHQWE